MERHTLSRIKLPTKIRNLTFAGGKPETRYLLNPWGQNQPLFPRACMVLLRPLDGGSNHLQIQKGCGRAQGSHLL